LQFLANGCNLTAINMNVAATYNTLNQVSNVDTVALPVLI
jgi:hypothetical protein